MKSPKPLLLELLDLIEFRWSAFLIYSIASVLSVSLRLKDFEANPTFIKDSIILGIGITSFTLGLLYIAFNFLTFVRSHQRKCSFGVLILLPIAGAIRGLVLFFEIDFYGYTNRISILNSTISSMIYTSIFYGGASILISLLLKKNRIFHSEFHQAAFFRFKREIESNPLSKSVNYEEAMQAISNAIASKVSKPTDFEATQLKRISEEIRFQVEHVLRPLSHRLWVDSFGEIRIGQPFQILKDATIELRFSKLFIIGYQFIVGVFGIGMALGLATGIFKSTIATIASLILFYIYETFWLERHGPSLSGSLTLLLLVAVIPVLASEIASQAVGIKTDLVSGAIIAPALPAILLVSAVYGLISRDKEFALSAVRSIKQSESNNFGIGENSHESRQLAEYLHNTLQSDLLRISKKIESSTKSEELEAYLSEMKTALSRSRSEVDTLRLKGIERLESVCQAWGGIATISLKTINLNAISREKIAQVVSLIEEIISNSIRIGKADVIGIEMTGRSSTIQISIRHNGSQVLAPGQGLGSISLMTSAIEPPIFTSSKAGVRLDFTI